MPSYKGFGILNNPEAKSLLDWQEKIFGFNLGQKLMLQ
jgi:hypothetical protein